MTNVWPTLPGPLKGTFQESRRASYIEDTNEIGANKRRARYSKSLYNVSFSLLLTDAQVTTLENFFMTTLGQGVDQFQWTHPRSDEVLDMRFDSYPEISDNPSSATKYNVGIKLSQV